LRLVSGPLASRHLLVSAPAGAGKSTFASQWADTFQEAAWIGLIEEDNEPGRFWAAFMMAIGTVAPELGAGAIAPLIAGGDIHSELVGLVGELAADGREIAVVVDDLHVVDSADCLTQLAWLLEYSPPNLHVGICSRTDPPLALDRLAAHGDLTIIRGPDLLFDAQEATEFLGERLDIDLDAAAIEEIHARTEGWAAGLFLAAIAIRNGACATAIPAGGDRRVRSYLDAEVLETVDRGRLEFLEQVSLLERFSAELCDQVIGRSDSAMIIDQLEERNLFVIPLDRQGTWFRLHHLFGEFMAERMATRAPEETRRLYERAAQWYLDHDEISEAVRAFVKAGRLDAAAGVIAVHYPRYINLSRLGVTVARWLELLPEEVVCRSAPLCLAAAWVAGITGRIDEMRTHIERAAASDYEGPLPNGCASVAAETELIVAIFQFADHGAVLHHAREAARLDRPESPFWPLIQFVVGLVEYLTDGPTESAIEALTAAENCSRAPEHAVPAASAPALLAAAFAERGQRPDALGAVRRAADARDAFGVHRVPQAGISWWASSRALLALGCIQEAAHDAQAGVDATAGVPAEHDSTMVVPPCLIALARVRLAQGRVEEARVLLADAHRRLEIAPDPARLAAWLEEAEATCARRLEQRANVEPLSDREMVVLRMLDSGQSLSEIATELIVSRNTVKSQTTSIYRKLGVGSRPEAIERARSIGILIG
jgi:LuxR family maltose regulon positive regulatory protein